MKYCKNCLMPDTRPGSKFNEEDVCQACINFEKRKKIDWKKREKQLDKICDKYRREDGYYDCLIPVSGGKDSHRLLYEIKEKRDMNPLLITIGDPFTKTTAGLQNYRNLGETFNCDHLLFELSIDLFRRVTKIAFEETGEPLKFIEAAIYTVPLKTAVYYNIPLVIFGENSAYEYGTTDEDTHSANDYIFRIFKSINLEYWLKKGISKKEVNAIVPPKEKDFKKIKPEVIFMSYFVPWSSTQNLQIAKKYGFRDLSHEWIREGCIENFEQIDSIAYIVHLWLKYPKFGFQRVSDISSRRVRDGKISLQEAKKLIEENDKKMDQKALDDFISFLGYTTPRKFWDIVEKYWNKDIFEKKDGVWVMKEKIRKQMESIV